LVDSPAAGKRSETDFSACGVLSPAAQVPLVEPERLRTCAGESHVRVEFHRHHPLQVVERASPNRQPPPAGYLRAYRRNPNPRERGLGFGIWSLGFGVLI